MGSRMSKKRRVVFITIAMIVLIMVALGVGGWAYHEQPRFCSDLCHIMNPYLESWNGSDYGAGVHSAEGVTCLDCHEPTIQEQMNELLVFVKGDYTVPLEELEISDEFCYDCHLLDEHENKEQVVERAAELERNPHESHLLGEEIGCSACHHMHKPSEDQCTKCHDAIASEGGWATEDLVYTVGFQVWDPEMDCTVCKSMVPYVESMEDEELAPLGYAHAQNQVQQGKTGLTCLDCHEQTELQQIHNEAQADGRMIMLRPPNEFCLGCHVDNEHTNWVQIRERTADYVLDGEYINPHDPHPDNPEVGDLDCITCHKNHGEPLLIEGCNGCHHEGDFHEGCSGIGCHEW